MDRRFLKLPFQKDRLTRWTCPTCSNGKLRIQKDSFTVEQTRESLRARKHPEWDPEWIEYLYACVLECSNKDCKDKVSSNGRGWVTYSEEYNDEGELEQVFVDVFYPQYFYPHLNIFEYPKKTPEKVADEIVSSFELFFCSPPSASNHMRIAVENLLTDLKVRRFKRVNGRRLYLSLHQRIELLPSKHKGLTDRLMAVKWLGNSGSHSTTEITPDDVMDSYEIMEDVLHELYPDRKRNVTKLTKEINKKKGPRKKLRRGR